MIGTSDGEQYKDSMAATMALGASEKPADALIQEARYPGSPKPLGRPQDPEVGMRLEGEDVYRRSLIDPVDPKGGFLDEPTQGQQFRDFFGAEGGGSRGQPLNEDNSKGAIHPQDFLENLGINTRRGDMNLPHSIDNIDRNVDSPKDQRRQFAPESIKKNINLDPNVMAVLSQPHIAEAIANPKIDRTHEVPYVAGASNKPDDFTTHVDKSVPSSVTISGKTFDPAIPLNIHEQVEREVMDNLKKRGMSNEKAYEIAHHEYAEPAEDAWYKAHGIDVADVNKWWGSIDKKTEKDKGDFPPDLYKAPYPHDKVEGVKHEPSNVNQEWAMNAKFAPLNPMTPSYSNPGGHSQAPESIYAAALKTLSDDKVHIGTNHGEAYMNLQAAGSKTDKGFHEGFVTSKGRFVDRKEAGEIATKAQQVQKDQLYGGRLLSEHLPE